MDRDRRYPPTPYPPRSEATRAYRDGWDLGWKHLATLGATRSRDYYEGLGEGPSKHGYRDGARARWRYERRLARDDVKLRRAELEQMRAERVQAAMEEQPY